MKGVIAVKGITGKILRIDLTTGRITVEEPEEAFYRRYLGGAGIVSYYLLKEIAAGIDPFSAENKLVFALGTADRPSNGRCDA